MVLMMSSELVCCTVTVTVMVRVLLVPKNRKREAIFKRSGPPQLSR
jgi:hypothetical protein